MKYVLEDKWWGLAAQPGVENEGISQSSHNELVINCSHTVSTCKSFKIASVLDKNVSHGAWVVAVIFYKYFHIVQKTLKLMKPIYYPKIPACPATEND